MKHQIIRNRIAKFLGDCSKLSRKLRGVLTTILVLLAVTATALQQLGPWTYARSQAKPLISSVRAAQGVKSFGFCSAVGGVAFGAVATPLDGAVVEDLRYDANRDDGERVLVTLRKGEQTQKVVFPAYDWMAIPVARFAEGDQDALFTYFGKLEDEEEQQRRMKANERILNYHPAVCDTLVGIRLMQADLLAFHPAAPENFVVDGSPLKGPGETLRNPSENERDFSVINALYEQGQVRSYVICDVGVDISFRSVQEDGRAQLGFAGNPYWSCWRLKKDTKEIYEEYATQRKDSLIAKAKTYVSEHPEATKDDLKSYAESIVAAEKTDMLEGFNNYVDRNYFEVLTEPSQRISSKMAELEGGNPVVYRALKQVMHGAAFFRHVKAENSKVYASFMRSIKNVRPSPTVETPTVMIPPAKTAIIVPSEK